jgi:hypothetical protein
MELTVFQILSNTYGFPALAGGLAPPRRTSSIASFGHTSRQPSTNTPIASSQISCLPSAIFLLLSGASLAATCWRMSITVDGFCVGSRYRAFVFAAPLGFVAGHCPPKCGEPFPLSRCVSRRGAGKF